jgi:hypothetical protein
VKRCVLVVALALAFGGRVASAADCDPAEAAELRAHLASQRKKADRWNSVWRWTFTGASAATFGLAIANPFESLQAGLYASGGKAAIGALARWILPLRVNVPAETSDPCADVLALRKEIRRVGKKERGLFYMGHFGGILVNLGGAAYVWKADSGSKALLSIAVGYPVGLLSNYTMPRGAWHKYREASWTIPVVTAAPHKDGWIVSLSGAF